MDAWCRPAFFLGETGMDEISPMSLDGLDPIEEPPEDDARKIILGICAMAKKSRSQPMKEILDRLERFPYIQVVIFDEDVILNDPVEKWPICDCLISFYSKGFCLDKAIEYEKLRRPYVLNDLPMQYALMDRRAVYTTLKEHHIEHPRYAICEQSDEHVIEADDQIDVDGVVFQKPFVEKPVSAEDHNVYIYFPTSAGGGSQRLFRKIGSRSSVYSPVSRIRKTGAYIYEDFMPTDGTDVKVYTLGPDYAHAEARKSPALDGKVERDKNGKEVRYPVILTAKEKMIARMVCLAFKQTICGFDLLRANGRSFVCDVNGFSFVKNSMKYYDDCAKIIGNMVMRHLAPQLSIPWSIACQPEDIPIVPTTYGTMMELRSVIAVIRHGDRTPKQKMKMEVKHQKFFDLFAKYDGYEAGHLKLKRPKQLQEVLDIARSLLTDLNSQADPEIEEKKSKLEQLKSVLEMYGHFSGINRKVQLKYQPHGRPKKSSSDDESPREPSLVLILKWGGELTPAGKIQAEELGKAFRCMYPGGEGDYGQPGLGLLRLHSTFRHDLKIYASDEGRVQMTAAAFAKGLLALEGELTPILVQMVKSANTNGLLDNEPTSLSDYQNMAKQRLCDTFHQDRDFTLEDYQKLAPTNSPSLVHAMKFIKNPLAMLTRVNTLIQELTERIRTLKNDSESRDAKLYHGETWELMMRRWGKLEKDFKMKNGRFDITKIPDIYDCIKYDLQHNQDILKFEKGDELHTCSRALADIVVPQEYGIAEMEKLQIALSICTPLLTKIKCDLARNITEDSTRLDARYSKGVSTPHRHVRTRLYFTSESHIHSLLTLIRYGGLCDVKVDSQWKRAMDYVGAISELNYMTQIVIMMYEDPNKDVTSEERFHVELHFSPGAQTFDTDKNYPAGFGYRPQQPCTPRGKSPVAATTGETTPARARDVTHSADDVIIKSEDVIETADVIAMEEGSNLETSGEGDMDTETEVEDDVSSSRETLKSPSTDNLMLSLPSSPIQGFCRSRARLFRFLSESYSENDLPLIKHSFMEDQDVFDQTDDLAGGVATKRRSTSPISIEKNRNKSRHKSADDMGVGKSAGHRKQTTSDAEEDASARSQSFEEKTKFTDKPTSVMESFKRDDATSEGGSTISALPSPRRFSTSAAIGNSVLQQALMDGRQTRLSDLLYLPGLMANHRHSFATLFANALGEVKDKMSVWARVEPEIRRQNSIEFGLFGSMSDGVNEPVPAIRPLETLHNSLTLKQVEYFIDSLLVKLAIDGKDPYILGHAYSYSGPITVKHGRCIPLASTYSLSSSNNSSGGPPSPSSAPDDAAIKLRLLMEATRQHSMDFDSALMSPDMFTLRPVTDEPLPSSSSLPSTPGQDTSRSPRMARSKSSDVEGQAERHSSDFEK